VEQHRAITLTAPAACHLRKTSTALANSALLSFEGLGLGFDAGTRTDLVWDTLTTFLALHSHVSSVSVCSIASMIGKGLGPARCLLTRCHLDKGCKLGRYAVARHSPARKMLDKQTDAGLSPPRQLCSSALDPHSFIVLKTGEDMAGHNTVRSGRW